MPHITINSKSLFYTDSHSDTSTTTSSPESTTLFLHGLGSSSCFYATIVPTLQKTTRCIAVDYPGSGLSELGDEELSVESLARDAIALLDALKIPKVAVVGHSMGGILASHLASTHPSRINAVALLGPVNPAPNLASVFQARIETIRSNGLEALANTIPTAATSPQSTSLHHAFVRTLILSTTQAGYIALCEVIAKATKPDYGSVKVPLLIIAGGDDKTSPLEGCEGILRAYGSGEKDGEAEVGGREDKRLVVLKGVGHWHCVEDGGGVGKHLGGFLGGV